MDILFQVVLPTFFTALATFSIAILYYSFVDWEWVSLPDMDPDTRDDIARAVILVSALVFMITGIVFLLAPVK